MNGILLAKSGMGEKRVNVKDTGRVGETMDGATPRKMAGERLDLIPASLEHVCAELEGPERLADLLGVQVEPGWPPGDYDRNAQEFFRDLLKEGGAGLAGWLVWYGVLRGNASRPSMLIGAGGYFGPPEDDGTVEIGFSIMPSWRNSGYASELAGMLVTNAFSDARVKRVIAHTAPGNPASDKVLSWCGFTCMGMDLESGLNLYELLFRNVRRSPFSLSLQDGHRGRTKDG